MLWRPQLPGGFGQNLPEIREQISDLSSENSEILEKLCHVTGGRLVWRNLAGVPTSWYVDELQLRISEKKHPKVTWHLPLPLQSWSLHQDDHGHGGAWCIMVLVSTSEGPMLLGGWRCPWVSGTELGMWSIETCCYRLGLRPSEGVFLRWVLLVGLAFSDCHLMNLGCSGGANLTWWKLLAVFRSSLPFSTGSLRFITSLAKSRLPNPSGFEFFRPLRSCSARIILTDYCIYVVTLLLSSKEHGPGQNLYDFCQGSRHQQCYFVSGWKKTMLVATRILLPWLYFADEKSDFHIGDGCCPKLTVFQPLLFAYSEAWSHSHS